MWVFIEKLLQSRGVQLLARYVGQLILMAATYLHVAPATADVTSTAQLIAMLAISAICWVIDHYSHKVQTEKALDEVHNDGVAEGLAARDGSFTRSVIGLVLVCFLLAGCATSDKIGAAVSTAVATALTHIETNITFDPVTGTATATIHLKDAQGRDIYQYRPATKAEIKACQKQHDADEKALKDSFKQAQNEMKVSQKRELDLIKANRTHCADPVQVGAVVLSAPVIVETVDPTPVTLPDPGNGFFTIPADPNFKGVDHCVPDAKKCKNGACK